MSEELRLFLLGFVVDIPEDDYELFDSIGGSIDEAYNSGIRHGKSIIAKNILEKFEVV